MPASCAALLGDRQARVDRIAADVDDRALPARGLDLGERRVVGHEDLARGRRARGPPRRGSARGCRPTPPRRPALHSSPSAASFAETPRILNEPVRCRFSAFSITTPPARSEIVRDDSTGVCRAIASHGRPRGGDVVGRDGAHQSGTARTASISTSAPSGSAATPIVLRAGGRVREVRAVGLVDVLERRDVGDVDAAADRVG